MVIIAYYLLFCLFSACMQLLSRKHVDLSDKTRLYQCMNNYPLSHDKSRRAPSKKVVAVASGLLLAVACQGQPEESLPDAPYCMTPSDIPPAQKISATYTEGIRQILGSLNNASEEHVVAGRPMTKTGLYASAFKLTVHATAEAPYDKDVHVAVESMAPKPTITNVRSISSYVLGRTADGRSFTYSEQTLHHSDNGWKFTTEHLTAYTNPSNIESTHYISQPNGYACAYVEKKTPGADTLSSPHIVQSAEDAQAIGNTVLASLLRNAGAMEHETPGFLDSQELPAVSSDFWNAMEVTHPPIGLVQPVR